MPETKAQIRQQMKFNRKLYPLDQKSHDDTIITQTLLSLDVVLQAKSICSYISMDEEIDTQSFIRKLFKKNRQAIIIPKVKGNILEFYRIIDFQHLKESKFGVLEPDSYCQQVPVSYPDLFIVAGLAFTPDGYRIGYGKGYMDRTFSQTNAPRVALSYDFQILETLPFEEYDRRVDILVTPTRIINCTKQIKL